MEYIIGGILAIIVIIVVGLILRKRLYDQVDYYEDWKLDIMNRNVASDLARVKDLNLEGDTKDKFEHWKNEWEIILNEDLADVEEMLYDTEKAADRYSFPNAKKHMKKMDEKMVRVEEKIEKILRQLNDLLDTEETNRKSVAELEPKLIELRKHVSQNRYLYNKAEIRFEVEMDELHNKLMGYYELIDEGNYAQGAKIVGQVQDRLVVLEDEIEEFPLLYNSCKQELPLQLDELTKGIAEMKEEGYVIDHLDLTKEINAYQSRLIDLVVELEKEGSEKVKSGLPEMEERIKEMYELLEKEAVAKNYVESKIPSYEQALNEFAVTFTETKSQVDHLKETYYFEDSDLEKYLSLEKRLAQLKDQLKGFMIKVSENNSAHTKSRNELETAFKQLETLEEEHQEFKKGIQNLRKDEVEARNQLQHMYDEIYKTNRKLKNSNLPGVPSFIWTLIEEASNKNERVLACLDKQPLDIMEVQQVLTDAKNSVNSAIDNTNVMLEQAYLTEHVIQYANRYRSAYPILASKLSEAEGLFRRAEYELSLEQAANALEEIEPGALKKVEKFQELTVS